MRTIKATTIAILALGLLAGSAVGVAAQDEPSMDIAEVTGRVTFGDVLSPPDGEANADGIFVGQDFAVIHVWDTSDPRLAGDVTRTINFRNNMDLGAGIESTAYELTNDGGSWVGDGRGYGGPSGGSQFAALSGRDGYEGLSAYVVMEPAGSDDGWDLRGLIFPTEIPEVPEPYTAE